MKILNIDADTSINKICLFLTRNEMEEMRATLENLLRTPLDHHAHINDESYMHEIIVAIYTNENLDQFDERSKKLIIEDK